MGKGLLHPRVVASVLSSVQNRIQRRLTRPLHRFPPTDPHWQVCQALACRDAQGHMIQGLVCPCRFTSDAVTGVSIVTILFFFPSKRPSLKWWCDFKGKVVRTGVSVSSVSSVAWSVVISGLRRPHTWDLRALLYEPWAALSLPHSLFPIPCLSSYLVWALRTAGGDCPGQGLASRYSPWAKSGCLFIFVQPMS